jgi:membrane protease YdiL (CAAX protease family)
VLPRKDWLPERVIVFAIPLFALAMLGLAGEIAHPAGAAANRPKPEFVSVMVGTLGFQGVLLAGLTWFLQSHRRPWDEAFGFRSSPAGPALIQGVLVALVILPVAYGLQWLSALGLKQVGYTAVAQSSVEVLLRSGAGWQRVLIAVFAVGLAPAVEEMLFRGVFFVFVRDLGRPRLALIGSALLFGMVHNNLAALLPLTVFGAALAWLYARTGNLLACIAAHATFNLAPFVLLASGLDFGDAAGSS